MAPRALSVLLGLLSALAACVSPPRRAEPTGPYAVEVTTRTLSRQLSDGHTRRLDVTIWRPVRRDPSPLVLFSHGYSNDPRAYASLLHEVASHGLVVAAPSHEDCAVAPCPSDGPPNVTPALREARLGDLPQVTDALVADDALGVDGQRIGLIGQSLGGWTALHALDQDGRFLAAVVMNPALAIEPSPRPEGVRHPTLFMAGGLDPITPARELDAFFGRVHRPAALLVTVPRAGHAFMDSCYEGSATVPCRDTLAQTRLGTIMATVATAFLLHHLTGAPELPIGEAPDFTLRPAR